jgi:hypothetical protein
VHNPRPARPPQPHATAQRVDQWRSAVLLAWLKESGVYDLLNVTNAATTEVKASLEKHELKVAPSGPANPAGKLLEYRNALIANWLRDNGGLERIAKLAAAANGTAKGAPAAGTVSVASVKDRAPRTARRAAGGEGNADAFKSALVLAWLKDSGGWLARWGGGRNAWAAQSSCRYLPVYSFALAPEAGRRRGGLLAFPSPALPNSQTDLPTGTTIASKPASLIKHTRAIAPIPRRL